VRIRVENLRQEFGETVALDNVSFSFESGQVHGFIGPNGSGKTTTLRILATLQEPTAGDAFFDDVSLLPFARASKKSPSIPSRMNTSSTSRSLADSC
jgi:ABC-type multidrug transport system ATPase subunit